MYEPLPKELTLGESEIHDIGLFAKKDIKRGHDFGISHIQLPIVLRVCFELLTLMIFQPRWITKHGDSLLLMTLSLETN